MSYWTHFTGVFRTYHSGGGDYTECERRNHFKFRNRQLKKIVKAMEEFKDFMGYLYDDKRFSYQITPIFKYKTYKCGYWDYQEEIVVSFHGDLRDVGNWNKEINRAISNIWYEKGIYIKYGIVEIIGGGDVDIMTYRFDNQRIEIFKDTSSNIYSLENRLPNVKYNQEDYSITIDNRKWTKEDILENIEEFSAILDKYEIPHLIKNVNKRLW